jgi:cell wall-associated NlpC family hydrolase
VRTTLRHHSTWLIAASLCAALILAVATPAYAVTNAAIRAKRKQADAAQAKQLSLADDLESRGEERAAIEAKVADTRRQISDAESNLAIANLNLTQSQAQLDERVQSIYRNGSASPISILVGASNFSDFVTRLDLMRRIGDSDAAVVASVKDARANVESVRRSLEARQTEQLALQEAARQKQAEVNDALEAQKRYVASLNQDLKKLMADEVKRQQALARKKAAELAARRKQAAATSRSAPVGALGPAHSAVVAIAKRYLGVPYVWGGTSPSGFDCSGLVQYCYAQVGISLPRTSRMQFRFGSFIPANRTDLLEPGDLVFFGTNGNPDLVHHVALYIGGGTMIEAPYTGASVRESSLFARNDYVGGCRP